MSLIHYPTYALDANERSSLLTLDDVAEHLRVHPSTIYRLLKEKQLPAFKVGREWRFNRESIDLMFAVYRSIACWSDPAAGGVSSK